MMKTWLIRRPVRRPVSRATTAPSSSSVCRLPFISSSASPCRTSSTALAAAAWLCGASTMRALPRSMPLACGDSSRSSRPGPTRIGVISPFAAASSAPASAVSSHGCATAVGTGSQVAAPFQQLFVFSGSGFSRHIASRWHRDRRRDRSRRRSRLLEKEGENDRQRHAVEQRLERHLVVLERHAASLRR